MDAAGAGELQRRIEEHQHWRQAEAVRDGRQPSADPDAYDLVEIRDGARLYRDDRLIKRLVGGRWETELSEDGAGR